MLLNELARKFDYSRAVAGFGRTKVINNKLQFAGQVKQNFRIADYKILYFSRLLQ